MVSYGIFTFFILVLFCGTVYLFVTPVVNTSVDIVNDNINDGEVSHKFTTYYDVVIGIFKLIPLIGLIGVSLWAYIRALERRNQEGI